MFGQEYFKNQVCKLHTALSVCQYEDGYDYVAAKVYNLTVVNGRHMPETFGERLHYLFVKTGVESSIIAAYEKAAWENEESVQFPSWRELYKEMMAAEAA